MGRAGWIGSDRVDQDRWGRLGQKWIFRALGANHVSYRDKCKIVSPN